MGSGKQAREASDSFSVDMGLNPTKAQRDLNLSPASRALRLNFIRDPGAYAPGFMLSPAPQALNNIR
jgi:hypothetical protein